MHDLYSRVQQILPIAQKALGAQVQPEMQLSQIEIGTPVCGLLQRGNGATRQREVYKRTAGLEDVVDFIVAQAAKT